MTQNLEQTPLEKIPAFLLKEPLKAEAAPNADDVQMSLPAQYTRRRQSVSNDTADRRLIVLGKLSVAALLCVALWYWLG